MGLQELFESIACNKPDMVAVDIDDEEFQDTTIKLLSHALLSNSHLKKISIKKHKLTENAYWSLLDLLRNNPNITEFYCKPISLLSGANATFCQAAKRILDARRQSHQASVKEYLPYQATVNGNVNSEKHSRDSEECKEPETGLEPKEKIMKIKSSLDNTINPKTKI